jgi:hypothetical protein
MTPEEIKLYVQMLRNSSHNHDNVNSLKTMHTGFYEQYPTLFEKAIDSTFPLKYLDWMIEMSKNLDVNSSKEKIETLDTEVYDKLRADYINLDTASKSD